ncbi:DNA (cytosine-5)-methyltransferase 1/tRNA (cytosine38-C5)-methyltransferase [Geothermobacter ehrlichii]|uniref:DNA (cytosine-5-)-methyltransferase n=1 Tax=Geothermobacter ehrlichii TaxID=213224 RepID=A0A5D3WQ97_9BACT|nr:DNA cytosine methyltransferase [Geothermobacter ehrlichii]TYO99650.1 DNA (cytosine-5)-methyltransferase 1/tRNA (cytosine38-C5)-methyltransferase [Geothermobacter ehrlichii]
MARQVRALEFFCGIGGFAAAVRGHDVEVVCAFDQNLSAIGVYRHNFPEHEVRTGNLERITPDDLASLPADFWWLSPPCQPYSVRGRGADLDDPRARSLMHLLDILRQLPGELRPRNLALENVTGFARSRARRMLLACLQDLGYRIRECTLCPTELGIPMRRPRYYLAASRSFLAAPDPVARPPMRPLADYLLPEAAVDPRLLLPAEIVERFGNGFRILEPAADDAYTTCFTAGYGKSLMHAGSYLRCGPGVRRFAPMEIAALLHFPADFRFPAGMSLRQCWKLLGNSLSVAAVRQVLRQFFYPSTGEDEG